MIYDKYRGKYTGPQCVNETSCAPAKDLVVSLAMTLVDTIKQSARIPDSLFDLQ
jgi:hypothetical protein